jgi:hypothetical protein
MPATSDITEPELANGEAGDYHRKMDRRLIVLETRFDTILPALANKTDLIGMKGELKAEHTNTHIDVRDLSKHVHGFRRPVLRHLLTIASRLSLPLASRRKIPV